MSRTQKIFDELKAQGRKAFVPYITCGDPNLARTEEILPALEDAGAHVIELGVPFSDPVADGVVIQQASQRSLRAGTTVARILEMVGRMRPRLSAALTLFTYYNPIYRYGLERFCTDARQAGADAVLIPDLSPEESGPLLEHARQADLDTVFLIAPTSTEPRIKRVGEASRGFVYAVSLTGVTGAREGLPPELGAFIQRARPLLGDKPMVVGFGIGSRESAREVASLADGAVIGSALMKIVAAEGDTPQVAAKVGAFARELAAGVAEAATARPA